MGHDVSVADFIEWDVRNWSASLDYWKSNSTQDLSQCSVLEIGTGYGGLSLWLALQGARVTCSDVNGPQEVAIKLHRSRGVSHLITYESIDATNIPYRNRFDVICFKSTLGAINDRELQAKAINEMHKALKVGGELFFAENLTASAMHRFFRRKFVQWGRLWRYVSIEEMKEFLSQFSTVSTCAIGFAGTLGRSERQRSSLGVVDRLFFDHVIPEQWKYILIGVAKK